MRRGTVPLAGAVLLSALIATAVVLAVEWARHHTAVTWHPGDLLVYREAAQRMLGGGSPYDVDRHGYGFVYPPFAALLLAPLGWLGRATGYWGWTFASLLALQAAIWQLLGWWGVTDRRRRAQLLLAGTLVVLPLSPMAGTLLLGNVNLLLLALVLADLLWVRGRHQGILLGIAAGIKLTPLIFIPYLLLTGRVRAGVTAIVSFAATITVGLLLLPGPSLTYWGGRWFDSSVTRPAGEEAFGASIRGAVRALLPESVSPVWLPLSVAVGVAGIILAVRAHRRGEELLGVVVVAVTGLLISPVTWYPHWVWCLPVLALAARRAGDRPLSRTAVAGLWLVFLMPLPGWFAAYLITGTVLPERVWSGPAELLYFVAGAALLAVAAARLRHPAPPEPEPEPEPEPKPEPEPEPELEPAHKRGTR